MRRSVTIVPLTSILCFVVTCFIWNTYDYISIVPQRTIFDLFFSDPTSSAITICLRRLIMSAQLCKRSTVIDVTCACTDFSFIYSTLSGTRGCFAVLIVYQFTEHSDVPLVNNTLLLMKISSFSALFIYLFVYSLLAGPSPIDALILGATQIFN